MKIIEITAHYSRKVSVQPFGSMEYHGGATAQLEDGDDVQECFAKLTQECKQSVRRQMLASLREAKTDITDLLEHLPENVRHEIEARIKGEM